MKWLDVSEIVVGLVLEGKLSPDMVNPTDLHPPYHEIIPLVRDWGLDRPTLINKGVAHSDIKVATEAVENINGEMKPVEWLKSLTNIAARITAGNKLEQAAKDLKDGKEVDIGLAMKAVSMMDSGYRQLTPMSEVKEEGNPWILTGWKPLDENIGGLIRAGLVVIGASPGVGKTTLMLKIASKMIKKYKKQKCALFTLEMTMGQITQRAIELDDSLSQEDKDRILLGDSSYNINDIYAVASQYAASEKLCMIGVDFADLLVEGEQSEAIMGAIYRTLSQLAKKTGVPVVLISQLSRITYSGGIPKVNHLRYSGMAEAMSALILLIYNPTNILADFGTKSELEIVAGRGYLIEAKSRFGFKKGGPGAVMIDWDGLTGWGDSTIGWFGLAT